MQKSKQEVSKSVSFVQKGEKSVSASSHVMNIYQTRMMTKNLDMAMICLPLLSL